MESTERQIISSLVFSDLYNDIYSFLPADAFKVYSCREVYKVLLDEFNHGESHDIETISIKLVNENINQEDALKMLNDAVESSSVGFDAKKAAKALFDKYVAEKAQGIISSAKFTAKNFENERDRIIEELSKLNMPTSTYSTADQLVKNHEGDLLALKQNYIEIGFESLNDNVRFDAGNIFALGARPATGKSALALQILMDMALRGKKVLYFNLEMPQEEIYQRMLAHTTKLTLQRIRRHLKFNEDETRQIKEAGEKISRLKSNFITTTTCRTIPSICNLSRKLKPDIICVDYLQKIISVGKSDNRAVEVGNMCHQLKDLAIELNVPLFAIVQLNRNADPYKEPTMSEIKESGDIEQDASTIMLLWKTDKTDERKRGMRIDKNRQGVTGTYNFTFQGELMRFFDEHDFVEPTLEDIPMIFTQGG